MKLSGFLLAACLGVASLAGCSSGDGEIAVDAATTPLTTEGNDKLFTIRIVEARETGYPLAGLVVKALPDGKDPIVVSCTAVDTNTNGNLDKGESLTCTEAGTNQLDATVAGSELDIELYAQIDGQEEKVGGASWTPAK
jgi:hypothetical protein